MRLVLCVATRSAFAVAVSLCLIEHCASVPFFGEGNDDYDGFGDTTFTPARTTASPGLKPQPHDVRPAWNYDRWSGCSATNCFDGLQRRKVWCAVIKPSGPTEVDANYCSTLPKPDETQWCVNTEVCLQQVSHITWLTGAWSPCTARYTMTSPNQSDMPCDQTVGERFRSVYCASLTTNQTIPVEVCDRHFSIKPASITYCELNCSRDCVTTTFGPWTPCVRRIGATSCLNKKQYRRKHILVPPYRGKPCGPLLEERSCLPERLVNAVPDGRFCDDLSPANVRKFTYKVSTWSNCECTQEEESAMQSIKAGLREQLGRTRRRVTCVDENGGEVETANCVTDAQGDTPLESNVCLVRRKCNMRDWSASLSTYDCGCTDDGSLFRSGDDDAVADSDALCADFSTRALSVAAGTDYDGAVFRKCVRLFSWKVSRFGQCKLQNANIDCGYGVRLRDVLCVNLTDSRVIDEKYCKFLVKPSASELCTVACKSNCALSLWSPWSECLPGVCYASGDVVTQAGGHRIRTRSVLVQSTDDDNSCQHLAEFQRCTVQQCYRWKIVDRSKHCILPQNSACGMGKRSLKEICVNHQQVQVNAGKCTEKPMEKEQCVVPCPNDCVVSEWTDWSKCGEGERMRYRTVLKPAEEDGAACPETLEESEACDETPPTYHWRFGSWNPCVAIDGSCGAGFQSRSVDCVDERDDWVEPGNCTVPNSLTSSVKPIERRDCTVPCSISCYDSSLSNATAVCSSITWCPRLTRESRIDLIDVQNDAIETRVVQDGEAYIAKCSHHSQAASTKCTSPRADLDSNCHKYFWYTTGWSACVTSDACGAGIRIRKYDCVLLNTSSYNNDYDWLVGVIESSVRNHSDKIVPAQHCIDAYGPLPSTIEVMPCEVSCVTAGQCPYSPWTIWTPCTSKCVPSTRQRSVVASPDCIMPSPDRLVTFEMRQCPHCRHGIVLVPVQVGQWSSCILPNGIACGLGHRYRRLVCIDVDGNEVPNVNCSTKEYAEERCYVPCPLETQCDYTDWSAWSLCSVSCYNPKHFTVLQQIIRHQNASFDIAFAGSQTRYQKPRNGKLQRCPIRNESRFCEPNVECSDYRWLSTAWSACVLTKSGENASATYGTQCGMGIKSRTVKCYDYRDSANVREVRDALCNQTKPNEQEFCEIACQNECVMTQWSAWSRCSTPCSTSQYRYRSRSVISSSSALGMNASFCPHRDESQACELGKVCFEYSWRVKSWSPCIALSRIAATQVGYEAQRISNDGTLCGSGLRKRELECIANGDKVVALGWCSATIGMPNDSLIENCEVPCSADCILSPWTSWGKCVFSDSGTGYRSRQRSTLLSPVGSGRPCPDELEQVVPCSFTYAYRWDFTKWSSCTIDHAPALSSCGNGQRRRSVICVKSNGTRVADVYCELAMLPKPADSLLVESCYKPCPGDCAVTEWSPWSSCHRLCSQGLTTGVQTRSRAIIEQSQSPLTLPCPENTELIETRQCDGPCVTYYWSVSNWYEDKRAVWCARNDGLVVEGGCVGPAPASKWSCKECLLANSYCVPPSNSRLSNSTQVCQCKSNYIPRYRESKLIDCVINTSATIDTQSDAAFEDYYTEDASVELPVIDSKDVAPVQQRQMDPWYSSAILWYCAFGVGALVVTLFSIAAFALVNYLRNLKNKRNRRSLQCNQIRQATRTSTTSIDNQLTLLTSQKTLEGEINGSSPSMARNVRSPGKRNGYIELEQLNPLNTFPRC